MNDPADMAVGDLVAQVAIITGAGSGIGAATAKRFAAAGAKLVLGSIDDEYLEEVRAEIADTGAEVHTMHCDVRSNDDVAALVGLAKATYGRVDVVCNNAGVGGPKRKAATWEHTDEEWNRVFETNLRSILYMARHVVPLLIESKGRMVNTASVAGMVAWGTGVYGSSKAGVIHLTRAMAIELAPHGVRVNCVCPGTVATRFGEGLERDRSTYAAIPLGRRGEAPEIAEAILYLASNRSSYATGTALVLDGGYSVA